MASDPITTISVHSSTRRLLESVKVAGESYDELLQELVEANYSPAFLKELRRRIRESARYPAEQVFREARV